MTAVNDKLIGLPFNARGSTFNTSKRRRDPHAYLRENYVFHWLKITNANSYLVKHLQWCDKQHTVVFLMFLFLADESNQPLITNVNFQFLTVASW